MIKKIDTATKYYLYKKIADDNELSKRTDKIMRQMHEYDDIEILNKHDRLMKLTYKMVGDRMYKIEKDVFKADDNILYHSTNTLHGLNILLEGKLKVRGMFTIGLDGKLEIAMEKHLDEEKLFVSKTPGYFLYVVNENSRMKNNFSRNTMTFCINISELKENLYKRYEYIDQEIKPIQLDMPAYVSTEKAYRYIEEYLSGYNLETEEYFLNIDVNLIKYVKRIYYNKSSDLYMIAELNNDADNWTYYKVEPTWRKMEDLNEQ